ncbi:hypothetical protein JCM10213_006658 [Rhodosporidiobolus nylandii]
MNDRQTDELLALEAIYPDAVSWTLLDEDRGVEVKLVLPVELEEEREVEVCDWVAPTKVEAVKVEPVAVGEVVRQLESVKLEAAGEQKDGTAGRNKRRRGRGGKAQGGGGAAPAGQARPAERAAATQPDGVGATPTNGRVVPSQRQPPPPSSRPPAASPLKSPAPVSPPPLTSTDKPSRIRFTPRPPSPPPITAFPPASAAAAEAEKPRAKKLSVRYLPELELRVVLPAGYPETEGPRDIQVTDAKGWLGEERRKGAEAKLREVYGGEECLFPLVDLVSSSSPDFLSTFSLSFPLILRQGAPSPSTPSAASTPLSTTLRTFNLTAGASAFASSSHLCPLCFSTHSGKKCLRLASCGCVFCTPCLRDYFSLLITEGLVRSVACPSTGCVEERARWEKVQGAKGHEEDRPGRVSAEEVELLCGEESRKRWEWLKEKVRVESDPTIAFCPIDSCQAAVPKIEDEEKLRICPSCSYSFCQFCRRAWHGVRNACALPQSSAIVQAYLDGSPTERQALETRYGAANLKRLVAAYEEERALQEWLQQNATECPGCSCYVNKSSGCNHMTCAKCATHFCYRCGKSISPADPYKHFNTPGGRCYGKLFDFLPGQEPAPDEWVADIM